MFGLLMGLLPLIGILIIQSSYEGEINQKLHNCAGNCI